MNAVSLWEVTTLNEPSPGYIKIDIGSNGNFGLVDNYGNLNFIDTSASLKNHSVWKILRNGYWSCFKDSAFKIFSEDLALIETIQFPIGWNVDFHDIESLDNGHYILLGVERRVMDLSQIVEGGQTDANVDGVVLLEVDAVRNIHWNWNSFDYYNILDVTDDIDLTQPTIDFTHSNAIAVDMDGNLLLSNRHLDEITKINKTTKDIIWRWGGSACKNNEFGFIGDTINGFFGFSHQHAITVLPNGNYLLYDNGNLKPSRYSRAVEYSMNVNTKRVTKVWEYFKSPPSIYENSGNAQRLSNGNTLINWGEDRITEVSADGMVRLELTLIPFLANYRAFKYITKTNARTLSISGNGIYDFNGGNKERTKVKVNITSYSGSGNLTVERHDYPPPSSSYSGADFTSLIPFRWVITKSGVTSLSGTIIIKVSELSGIDNPGGLRIYKRNSETTGSFSEINTSYNSSTGEISGDFSGFGEFVLGSISLGKVNLISPSNNKLGTPISGSLKWQKLNGASSYRVQLSDDSLFVNKIINEVQGDVDEKSYSSLNNNKKYYWRVQAMNSQDTSEWSDVWRFTTELAVPVLLKPANDKFGLDLSSELTWNNVSGASGYWVQVARDSLFSDLIENRQQVTDSTIGLNLQEYNRLIFWKVMAFRSTDSSNWSPIRKFTTEMSSLELLAPSANEINIQIKGTFSWGDSPGAQYYGLLVSKDSLFNSNIIRKDSLNKNMLAFDSLDYNTKYFWRVRGIRTTDTSQWSLTGNFTTILKAPELSSPDDSSELSDNDVMLSWGLVSGANMYSLEISDVPNMQNKIVNVDSIKFAEFLAEDLPKNKWLYWRIQAKSGAKQSEWSKVFCFKILPDEPLSKALLISPENNIKNFPTSGYFNWFKVNEASSYKVEVALDSSFTQIKERVDNIKNTVIMFTDYLSSTEYFWRVKAFSSKDSSDWSDVWNFMTAENSNLPLMELLEPMDGSTKVAVGGQIQWNCDDTIKSYHLQISANAQFKSNVIDISNIKDEYFEYADLEYNTNYYLRIGSELQNSGIIWSETFEFLTELEPPVALLPLDSSIEIDKEGLLKWTVPEGAESFDVQLSDDSLFNSLIIDVSGHPSNEMFYSLSDSTNYYWQVKCMNDSNESRWSDIYRFKTKKVTDVKDNEFINSISVYPNPVSSNAILEVLAESPMKTSISLINVLGKSVKIDAPYTSENGSNIYKLDLSDLHGGMYILLILSSQGTSSTMIIKE